MTVRAPAFLTLDEVLALHADQIERYGGASGLRDLALLESAVAAPKATFGGRHLHATVPEMAAAYVFHLAQNHPFVDGNKRVALAAGIAFLGLNDLWLEADPDDLAETVLSVARGEVTKAGLAEYLRAHAVPLGVP
ncbi:MAG TPA: type II toxin-antitoxin system death-on-curing family toxin [Anaeromyxobacter sp.]